MSAALAGLSRLTMVLQSSISTSISFSWHFAVPSKAWSQSVSRYGIALHVVAAKSMITVLTNDTLYDLDRQVCQACNPGHLRLLLLQWRSKIVL